MGGERGTGGALGRVTEHPVVEGSEARVCGGREGADLGGVGAAVDGDPDVAAAGTGRSAEDVRDRELVERAGEHGGLVLGLLHQLRDDARAVLAVEVEAQQPVPAGGIRQSDRPRRRRRSGAERVQPGVAVPVEPAVGVTDHRPHLVAWTQAAREIPCTEEIRVFGCMYRIVRYSDGHSEASREGWWNFLSSNLLAWQR